jgi:hypothetical protein
MPVSLHQKALMDARPATFSFDRNIQPDLVPLSPKIVD